MTIAEETVRNNGLKLSFCHLFCNFENFLHVPIWAFPPTRFPEVIVLDMTLPVIREEIVSRDCVSYCKIESK